MYHHPALLTRGPRKPPVNPRFVQLSLLTGRSREPHVNNYILAQMKAGNPRYLQLGCPREPPVSNYILAQIKANSPRYSQPALLIGGPRDPPANNYILEQIK